MSSPTAQLEVDIINAATSVLQALTSVLTEDVTPNDVKDAAAGTVFLLGIAGPAIEFACSFIPD